METNNIEYELLNLIIRPCIEYIEGEKQEDCWVDDQNALHYYFNDDDDDVPGTIKETGKKHWLIQAYKPKGVKVTEENEDDVVVYAVYLGPREDIGKVWDFTNHCPTDRKIR